MKIHETFDYDGVDATTAFGLIGDEAFRNESCVNQGDLEHEVTVTETPDGGVTLVLVRTQPATMPDFIQKLTGTTVKIKQTEAWGPADADGNRTADVSVNIIGQPATMTGTSTLRNTASGSVLTLDGDVKVAVPFLGKKIEPEVAKAILASLREEVAYGRSKL